MDLTSNIDPLWIAEFRGFFYADGYLGITTNGLSLDKKYKNFTARAQITLSQKDEKVLLDIQEKLGGNIHYENRCKTGFVHDKPVKTGPYCAWRVRSKVDVGKVIQFLENGLLPAKKREEVKIVKEFLETVGTGRFKTENERAAIMHKRLTLHIEIMQMHS